MRIDIFLILTFTAVVAATGRHHQPQCSPPVCNKRCKINYDAKPCPSCDCTKDKRGSDKNARIPNNGPICGVPKCNRRCKIDYDAKPCPSCDCSKDKRGSSKTTKNEIQANKVQCKMPRCNRRCKINYDTKPCPSCDCTKDKGTRERNTKEEVQRAKVHCSPPRCGDGCTINYETEPCPSCKCDKNKGTSNKHKKSSHRKSGNKVAKRECNLPPACTANKDCRIDKSSKPCPTCKCKMGGSEVIMCLGVKCDGGKTAPCAPEGECPFCPQKGTVCPGPKPKRG